MVTVLWLNGLATCHHGEHRTAAMGHECRFPSLRGRSVPPPTPERLPRSSEPTLRATIRPSSAVIRGSIVDLLLPCDQRPITDWPERRPSCAHRRHFSSRTSTGRFRRPANAFAFPCSSSQSRLRTGHGTKNMAIVRHFALNLVRQCADKRSIKRRCKRAAWSPKYLMEILGPL
jgi:hypothetical protein